MNFPPFRIDRDQGRLWRGDEVIPLRRKTWDVLVYLAARPGALVTKDDLLAAVWGDTAVQEAVITNCVLELRRALGDDRRAPRFIEVVYGRGFRWVAVGADTKGEAPGPSDESLAQAQVPAPGPEVRAACVGRELELQRLRASWDAALAGQRQVVLISGEPGIGKTTVVDEFIRGLGVKGLAVKGPSSPNPVTASRLTPYLLRGQCVEILGEGEPYLPVLDAIARLCTESQDAAVLDALRRCAPTWLAQMPWVVDEEAARAIELVAAGATQDRMLRELASALDLIAGQRPLILVLEDLHWADPATLDLLAFLARRDLAIRMLVIGTYRPADAIVRQSRLIGLKQDLINQKRAVELALDHLRETMVQEYLDRRFGEHDLPPALATAICRHTDGHPMFMSAVVDELVLRGSLIEREQRWQAAATVAELELGLPVTLKRMLDCQIEHLEPDDVQLLEAASAAGLEFSSQELASALERHPEDIEEQCERLVRRQLFLRDIGLRDWPDGTSGERYAFIHGLYQRALYQRLPANRRRRLHRRIGDRLENGYQSRPIEVASELAAHFEAAAELERCAKYLVVSGHAALRRASPQTALTRFRRGLEMVAQLPAGPPRLRREVEGWSGVAAALEYSTGLADPEVCDAFARLETLCQGLNEIDNAPLLLEALYSAWGFRLASGDLVRAAILADRLATVGRSLPGGVGVLCAGAAQGNTLLARGHLAAAGDAFQRALGTEGSGEEWAAILHYIPRVYALGCASQVSWLRGDIDRAAELSGQATDLTRVLTHPHSEMFSLDSKLVLAAFARDESAIAVHCAELSLLAERYEIPLFVVLARLYSAWVRARAANAESIVDLEAIGSMLQTMGFEYSVVGVDWLRADALVNVGHFGEALTVIDVALQRIETTGIRLCEAEVHRLRGEALAGQSPSTPPPPEAEQCIRRAIAVAEQQGARWWELRARISLAHLLDATPAADEARRQVAVLGAQFTGGRETADVREACRLGRL